MQRTPDGAPVIGSRVFGHMLLIDALLYAVLLMRDYDQPGQALVAHYVGFVVISDLGALFLPADKRHWFNLFRLAGGVALLTLTVSLAVQDLNGDALALTATQCGLALLRLAHAGWLIKVYGPNARELRAFPALAAGRIRHGHGSDRLSVGFLLIAAGGLFFPHLIFWTHHNDGTSALDAVLTGMSAQNGLNVFLKLFVLEVLITGAARTLALRSTVAALFAAQVLVMPQMYYSAPLPFAHFLAEAYLLLLVVVGARHWRIGSVPRPAVRSD